MEFNRCMRCGSFFNNGEGVCPNCKTKDEIDKMSLRNYIENNELPQNMEALSFQSGVSIKNLNRYFETDEFSSIKNQFLPGNTTKLNG